MEEIALDLVKGSIESLLKATAVRIGEEIVLIWGLKADLNNLKKELKEVNGLLVGAESKFGSGSPLAENPLFKEWVKAVAQVAYRAEDVIDGYAYEILKRKMELAEMAEMKSPVLRWKTKVGLLWCFSNNNPVVFRLRVAHKVKSLRESIAEISANAKRLGIKLVDVADAAGASQHSTSDHTATSWAERQLQLRRENVDYEGLIGRDRFIDQIKEELRMASDSDKRLTVIGIHGMGGTTTTHLQFYFLQSDECFVII